jgi:hypothetical protein
MQILSATWGSWAGAKPGTLVGELGESEQRPRSAFNRDSLSGNDEEAAYPLRICSGGDGRLHPSFHLVGLRYRHLGFLRLACRVTFGART